MRSSKKKSCLRKGTGPYSRSHTWRLQDGTSVPWIDESVHPDTGKWIVHGNYPETRGRFYNHSSYCDLIITGLVGLRPRADDIVEVNPLLPAELGEVLRSLRSADVRP